MLLNIERHSTFRNVAVLTGLTAAVMIIGRLAFPEAIQGKVIPSLVIGFSLVVTLVPNGLHIVLSQELEAMLIARPGELWGEGNGPRILNVFRFKTELSEELDSIEQRYGEQLSEDEADMLFAARRQRTLGG